MKDFLKYVGATVVGLVITGILAGVFFFISLIGMIVAGDATEPVKDNSVLVLNLSGLMQERSERDPFADLGGSQVTIGLDDVVNSINIARKNKHVKGIYIEAGAFGADSYASLQAVRDALGNFRKSGKWIIAYGDTYTQGAYYVASAANKLYLNPQGQIDWHGLAAQPMYLKDLLGKFGVKMQVAKVGTYKSATEAYTADGMSDANRQQTTAYITAIWKNITAAVSRSRNIPENRLNQLADSVVTLADPQQYITAGLADSLIYTDQVKDIVKRQLGIDTDDEIKQVSPRDLIAAGDDDGDDEIAVYYAYGEVVDGAASGIGGSHYIDAQKVCRDLEDLMNDDDVKAVVLRVNSGGGSAYASEQIWHQMVELRKKKPVVVSMGGMAASGAYYISAPANWIVAEPTTLTGSIGIFGMFPDMSGLLKEKLGLKFDVVKTNAHSDFGTTTRPFTDEEMRYLDAYINRGYRLFRQRVADGRKMSTAEVEKVAQGHVFAGQDAIKIRLVDQLGGLDAAIAKAAQLAKTGSYYTTSYPETMSWVDALFEKVSHGNYLDERMRVELGPLYEPVMLLRNIDKRDAIQARLPYDLNVK